MFCPKCAAKNAEDAQFCRSCGANISLVPQAVAGQLAARPEADDAGRERGGHRRHGREKDVTVERAVRGIFMGVAFILIAFSARVWAPAGHVWWFWMFIPAAGLLADGISTFVRLQEAKRKLAPPAFAPAPAAFAQPPRASELPPRNTGEIVQPPSVTEATTRHLGVPAARKSEDA